LLDFLSKAVKVRTVQDKRDAYPNLVLFHEGFLFCSVHLTLVKPEGIGAIKIGNHSEIFAERVNDEALAASGVLTQQINLWRESFGRDSDPQRALAERVHQLEAELHAVQVKFREATEHNHSNEGRLLDILNTGSISAVDFDETVQFIENFRVDRLHHLVGNFRDHELHSDGASGFLCFGPYATLDIGHYRVEFELYARGDAEGYVSADVCVDQGTNILTKRDLRASELIENLHLEFSLDIPSTDIEFRIAVSGAVDFVFRGARLVQRRIT
jgi:hypothetical protein